MIEQKNIYTYLALSLDHLNLFGTGLKLRRLDEVIEKKEEEAVERFIQEKKRSEEIEGLKRQRDKAHKEKEDMYDLAKRVSDQETQSVAIAKKNKSLVLKYEEMLKKALKMIDARDKAINLLMNKGDSNSLSEIYKILANSTKNDEK